MYTGTDGTYIPVPGDFDGDGYGDVIFYGVGTVGDYIYFGTATRGTMNRSSSIGAVNPIYTPVP